MRDFALCEGGFRSVVCCQLLDMETSRRAADGSNNSNTNTTIPTTNSSDNRLLSLYPLSTVNRRSGDAGYAMLWR